MINYICKFEYYYVLQVVWDFCQFAQANLLDVSGRPDTRDYGKALEAIKLLTENVLRRPHEGVMATTRLDRRAHNYS